MLVRYSENLGSKITEFSGSSKSSSDSCPLELKLSSYSRDRFLTSVVFCDNYSPEIYVLNRKNKTFWLERIYDQNQDSQHCSWRWAGVCKMAVDSPETNLRNLADSDCLRLFLDSLKNHLWSFRFSEALSFDWDLKIGFPMVRFLHNVFDTFFDVSDIAHIGMIPERFLSIFKENDINVQLILRYFGKPDSCY